MKFFAFAFATITLLQTPDPTLPPAGASVVKTVQGRGVQIYRCDVAAGAYQWILQAPEAKLFNDSGLKVGTHSAGPTWTWNDGSAVRGTVLVKKPSEDASSIPWLLLSATAAPGSGVLSPVAFVRRSETHGGNAPAAGCDDSHGGASQRVPYTATYTFYKKAQ